MDYTSGPKQAEEQTPVTGKHKSEPWYVEFNAATAVLPGHLIKKVADPHTPVALVWEGGGSHGKQNAVAHARLIAKAPEMAEALKQLLECELYCACGGGDFTTLDGENHSAECPWLNAERVLLEAGVL